MGVGDGLSIAAAFFLWRGEALALGEADSSFSAAARFLFEEGCGVGDGDSSVLGECFFFGDGDGVPVGDLAGDVEAFFFLWGVGVGVEKIFFSLSPNDCSAAPARGAAMQMQMAKIRVRKIM